MCRILRHHFIFTAMLLVVGSGICRSDILIPGTKFVSHKMKFENLSAFQKEYKFFFLPLNDTVGESGMKEQETLNKTDEVHVSGISRVAIARARGMFLVAVPRTLLKADGSVDLKTLENPPEGVLKSESLVSQIRAVDKSDKDEFWTIYSVKIQEGKLQLGLMRHDEPKKRAGVTAIPSQGQGLFAGVSALIAFGILSLRLRQSK
jgi:hypothetical protein